jgi:hypothetical protein
VLGVAVLAAAALLGTAPTGARADMPISADRLPAATAAGGTLRAEPATDVRLPRPGTEDEQSAYARREAESPEVQQYAGGFIIFLLVVAALILLIIVLAKQI